MYIAVGGRTVQRFLITKEIAAAYEKTMVRPFQRHSRMIQDNDVLQNTSSSFFSKKNKSIPGAAHNAENALKLHFKRTVRVLKNLAEFF